MQYLSRLPEYLPEVRHAEHGPHVVDLDTIVAYAWQKRWEFEQLLYLYISRRPPRILELGTAGGGTLFWWLKHAVKGATIVSVDSYSKNRGWYATKDNRALYPQWIPQGVNLEVVEGLTQDDRIIDRVEKFGPYDWIFIDAGHTYNEVRCEWTMYSKMCKPGGVVALHDIYTQSDGPSICEVSRLWNEIRTQGYLTQEIVAIPNSKDTWGIGVVYF